MGKMQMASFLAVVAIVSCLMAQSTNALIHVVGGDKGWNADPNNKELYAQWAAPRTFGVGDQLVFPYHPASETVFQVSKEGYDTCCRKTVISQWIMGPTVLPLTTPGDYYFISDVGLHCEMGVKLHIVVGTQPGSDGINWKAVVSPLHTRKLLVGAPTSAPALAPAPTPRS